MEQRRAALEQSYEAPSTLDNDKRNLEKRYVEPSGDINMPPEERQYPEIKPNDVTRLESNYFRNARIVPPEEATTPLFANQEQRKAYLEMLYRRDFDKKD